MSNDCWGYTEYTIIDRVQEIEKALKKKMYQSALALALTLPDICGGIMCPNADTGFRYKAWFNKSVTAMYQPKCLPKVCDSTKRIINGEIIYKLRCAYLHSGEDRASNGEIKKQLCGKEDKGYTVSFNLILTLDMEGIMCNTDSEESLRQYEIYINIRKLCKNLCEATRTYLEHIEEKNIYLRSTSLYSSVQWHIDCEEFEKEVRGEE